MASNTNGPKKTTTTKIESKDYANIKTGEMLDSEHPGAITARQIDESLVVMNSDEYVILDSRAMAYVQKYFSPTDLGRIMQMSDLTYGEFNILYNGRGPHTKASLMEYLGYSRNKYADFMKRLEKKSIIYYITGYVEDKRVHHIMFNPNLARKRKTINTECLNWFHDIRKLK